jgi:small subunit ribosomal protein S6
VNEYELMAVLHPRLTADETEGAIEFLKEQVTSNGGEIIDVDNWGRRRLAYPIDANYEGTYVLTTLRLPPEGTRAFESRLLLSEDVIRHLLIRGIIPYEGEDPRQSQVRPGASAGAADAPPEPVPSAEAADAPAEAGDESTAVAAATTDEEASEAPAAEAPVAEATADADDAAAEDATADEATVDDAVADDAVADEAAADGAASDSDAEAETSDAAGAGDDEQPAAE